MSRNERVSTKAGVALIGYLAGGGTSKVDGLVAAIEREARESAGTGLDVEILSQAHRNVFMDTGEGLFSGYLDALIAEVARLSSSDTGEVGS